MARKTARKTTRKTTRKTAPSLGRFRCGGCRKVFVGRRTVKRHYDDAKARGHRLHQSDWTNDLAIAVDESGDEEDVVDLPDSQVVGPKDSSDSQNTTSQTIDTTSAAADITITDSVESNPGPAAPSSEDAHASSGIDDPLNYHDYNFLGTIDPALFEPISPTALVDPYYSSFSPPMHANQPRTLPLPPQEVVPILDSADPSPQLRSSRTTRNQEHQPTRNRAGFVDYDPTDGLPVRKWVRETVEVNQDAAADATDSNDNTTKNKESDFPWEEHPLPSFWSQLQPHSQELIRRARMGDIHAKPSVWDRTTKQWIPSHEAEARKGGLKSKHLMNVDLDENDHDDEDDDEVSGDEDDSAPHGAISSKKRKITGGLVERTFEAKKWVQVPVDKADTIPEPKYLADRRPGMPSLYTSVYKSTNGYGAIGVSGAGSSGLATNLGGFDLGDGSGLGNAIGSGGAGIEGGGQATAVRKNMPPKRKKKKLGGPGRKKAVTITEQSGDVEMGGTTNESGEKMDEEKAADDNDEGTGSESEGEGSEEGEIEEGVPEPSVAAPATDDGQGAVDTTTTEAKEQNDTVPGDSDKPATSEATIQAPVGPIIPIIPEPAPEAGEVSAPTILLEPTPPTPPPPAEEAIQYIEVENKAEPEGELQPQASATTEVTGGDEKPETEKAEEAKETDLLGDLEAAVDGMKE